LTVTFRRHSERDFRRYSAVTATVTGSTNTAVTWTAFAGSISSLGLFTAPTVSTSTCRRQNLWCTWIQTAGVWRRGRDRDRSGSRLSRIGGAGVTAIISDLRYCSANNSITNVSVASSGASGGRFKPAAARWNTWQLLEQQFDSRHTCNISVIGTASNQAI